MVDVVGVVVSVNLVIVSNWSRGDAGHGSLADQKPHSSVERGALALLSVHAKKETPLLNAMAIFMSAADLAIGLCSLQSALESLLQANSMTGQKRRQCSEPTSPEPQSGHVK